MLSGRAEARTLQGAEGGSVHVVIRAVPLKHGGDEPVWVLLAAEAAHRRRWMTDQLVLAGLFAQSPILLAVYNTDACYMWINDVLRPRVGLHPEECIGHTNDELLPQGEIVSPQYPSSLDEVIREVATIGEPILDLVYRGPTPLSPRHDHVWSCSYFRLQDPDGKVLGVCESAFDVTERCEAQMRLKLLSQASRIGTTLDAATDG